jgi:hypothetical protein
MPAALTKSSIGDSALVPVFSQPPRQIAGRLKIYAFERSLGIVPAEASRRAGGKVESGNAIKWEQNERVQAWIAYFHSLGFTAEALAAAEALPAPPPEEEGAAFKATREITRCFIALGLFGAPPAF